MMCSCLVLLFCHDPAAQMNNDRRPSLLEGRERVSLASWNEVVHTLDVARRMRRRKGGAGDEQEVIDVDGGEPEGLREWPLGGGLATRLAIIPSDPSDRTGGLRQSPTPPAAPGPRDVRVTVCSSTGADQDWPLRRRELEAALLSSGRRPSTSVGRTCAGVVADPPRDAVAARVRNAAFDDDPRSAATRLVARLPRDMLQDLELASARAYDGSERGDDPTITTPKSSSDGVKHLSGALSCHGLTSTRKTNDQGLEALLRRVVADEVAILRRHVDHRFDAIERLLLRHCVVEPSPEWTSP